MDEQRLAGPATAEPGAVLAAFGLRGPVRSITPVAGAWSNRVWRLCTAADAYAVKQLLNPFGEPRWRERIEAAFAFELAAHGLGISMPRPVPTPAGDCVAEVTASDGTAVPVRVHHWVDGQPMSREPVDGPVAAWVGRTLAQLHRLDVRPPDRSVFPVLHTDTTARWPELTAEAHAVNAPWAADLAAVQPLVNRIAWLVERAGRDRQVERMSHGDIDQKNLLVTAGGGPVLCDFDVAHPLQRRSELADVALSMGCWRNPAASRAVLAAYAEARGPASTRLRATDLAWALMSALDWIELTARRALTELRSSQGPADRHRISALCASLGDRVAAADSLADPAPGTVVRGLR